MKATPCEEKNFRVFTSHEIRLQNFLFQKFELLGSLFNHIDSDIAGFSDVTKFIMLITIGIHHGAFHFSRNQSWGYSIIGQLISLVFFSVSVDFFIRQMPFDGNLIQVKRRYGSYSIRHVLVSQENDRNLVLVCQVEGSRCLIECVFGMSQGDDHLREFSMRRIDDELKVTLLCSCWQTSGWSGSLYFCDDQRCFSDSCHTDSFHHKRVSTTGSTCHGSYAGIGGTYGHIDGRNLILSLFYYDFCRN